MRRIYLGLFLTTTLISSAFSITAIRDYIETTGYGFEEACFQYRQGMTEEFRHTMDIVDDALILQTEYNCEKILFFAEQLNVEPHDSLRAPYDIVNEWYGTTTYIELLQRREEQLLQVIEGKVIDERFGNFITFAKKFSPQSYEKIRLEYLKFRHLQLTQWIDESSYKDVDTTFEGYTGSAFYEVAKNYAEKGMAGDVQRIIELHNAYPVVSRFSEFEDGIRNIYVERIEKETKKQLLLFSEKQKAKEIAIEASETDKELTVQTPGESAVEPISENTEVEILEKEPDVSVPTGQKDYWSTVLISTVFILVYLVIRRRRKRNDY